jgi:hypothetical protein
MEWSIQFQYLSPGSKRPDDSVQDDRITVLDGQFFLIPAVGDSVVYRTGGKNVHRKVVTRRFCYDARLCFVNIVVEDMTTEEYCLRMSE